MTINHHMRHLRNNCRSYSFGDIISTTATLQSSTLHTSGKEYIYFEMKGESDHESQCDKSSQ